MQSPAQRDLSSPFSIAFTQRHVSYTIYTKGPTLGFVVFRRPIRILGRYGNKDRDLRSRATQTNNKLFNQLQLFFEKQLFLFLL
jgi:hypothetical protein